MAERFYFMPSQRIESGTMHVSQNFKSGVSLILNESENNKCNENCNDHQIYPPWCHIEPVEG